MIDSVFSTPEEALCHPDHRHHAPLGQSSSPRDCDKGWNNTKEQRIQVPQYSARPCKCFQSQSSGGDTRGSILSDSNSPQWIATNRKLRLGVFMIIKKKKLERRKNLHTKDSKSPRQALTARRRKGSPDTREWTLSTITTLSIAIASCVSSRQYSLLHRRFDQ